MQLKEKEGEGGRRVATHRHAFPHTYLCLGGHGS